jgi:hypothetical protein
MKLLLPAAMEETASSPISPLEEQLAGPDGAVAKAQALREVDALALRVRAQLSKGLVPSEYARWLAIQQACQAAREVLTMVQTAP